MSELTDQLIGKEIDGYRIVDVLGRGGMGIVYKAVDIQLDRFVALKMIDPGLAYDEAFLRRFRSEARGLARTNSPYIVQIHALRKSDQWLFIDMEYVEGETLSELILKGKVSWEVAAPLLRQMLMALENAHGVGVIHRDIKPSNVLLTPEGKVKVTDFGLAKVHQASTDSTVTQGVAGTLYYMAPEQVKGLSDLDHRCDLYSLGMTAYEMLAGELPFPKGNSQYRIMREIVEGERPSLAKKRPDLPRDVSAAVEKALEKDPDHRFQTALEMREAVERVNGKGAAVGFAPAAPVARAAKPHATPPAMPGPPPAEGLPAAQQPGGIVAPAGRRNWIYGLGAFAVLAVGVSAFFMLSGDGAADQGSQLFVRSEPAGATVYVNRDSIGTTPLAEISVAEGPVHVSVERAGYRTRDTLLQAAPGGRHILTLNLDAAAPVDPESPDNGRFTIRAPADASVYVDGQFVGRGTVDQSVASGRYSIEVRQEGFRPWRETLRIGRADEQVRTVRLERSSTAEVRPTETPRPETTRPETPPATRATLTVKTRGAGTAQVDGRAVSANQAFALDPGAHTLACVHDGTGRKIDKSVTLQAGGALEETCHFVNRVVLTMKEGPFSAYYYLNDKEGEALVLGSPVTLELPPGTHRFSVRKSGFKSTEGPQTIEVNPTFTDRTYQLSFSLRKE